MSKTIEVSDSLYQRLQSLGGQLFTFEEVIERLMKGALPASGFDTVAAGASAERLPSIPRADLKVLPRRTPRQRGVTVEVAGQRIDASTVSDLYEQVMRLVLSKGRAEKLNSILPYRTSKERYLIAREPKHPNGKGFFAKVKVGIYYLEAHKNYETALKQLAQLLGKLDLDLRYVG